MTANLITIRIAGIASDGDPSRGPTGVGYFLDTHNTRHLKDLAEQYCLRRGIAPAQASTYTFDALPWGFRLFGKTRTNNPSHIDHYYYGHHSGRRWRSAVTFSKHLNHLIINGITPGCDCELCARHGDIPPPPQNTLAPAGPPNPPPGPQFSNNQAPHFFGGFQGQTFTQQAPTQGPQYQTQHSVRTDNQGQSSSPLPNMDSQNQPHQTNQTDEDDATDLIAYYTWKLKEEGYLDEDITEDRSIDWLLEHEVADVHRYISALRLQQKMWQPRGGEIVLFIRHVEATHSLRFDETDSTYKLWDRTKRAWGGYPLWEAGLITQQPGEAIAVHDIYDDNGKVNNVVTSGYRVEPVPDVGNIDKPWSKRYTHVPVKHMRPMVYFLQVLRGINSTDWHPTIRHALTTMSSISFVNRYYVRSEQPGKFVIHNRGMYLGPEFIITDDVVRLVPKDEEEPFVHDIMKIKRIKHIVVVGTHNQRESSACHVTGKILTQDPTRAWGMGKTSILRDHLPQKCSERYGPWYWTHDPTLDQEIPFRRILSRCYEPEGLLEMFPAASYNAPPSSSIYTSTYDQPQNKVPNINADLSYGLDSCLKGREYSRQHDGRIRGQRGKEWHWANFRIEQLDVNMVHGHDVGGAARYGSDPNTEPRKAKHDLAAFRARRAREKGNKGMGVYRGLGAYKGHPVIPSSGLAAAGVNQIDILAKDKHKFQTSGLAAAGLNVVPHFGFKRSRSDEEFAEIAERHRRKPAAEGQSSEKQPTEFPTKDDVDELINHFAIPGDGDGDGNDGASGGETSGAVPAGEDPVEAFFD